MKKILFEEAASEDIFYWASNDIKILKRIIELIENIKKNPFVGIGKPEPLKHNLKGFWSRRINDTHRIVYQATQEFIIIASCRHHY
ncbi:MAG: toxin YoeB [Bacteroidetes bacterium GWA2_30_7]|nr:MAG: toxin YoeB [Bacteroidetes bacterium GWA2_30_7]